MAKFLNAVKLDQRPTLFGDWAKKEHKNIDKATPLLTHISPAVSMLRGPLWRTACKAVDNSSGGAKAPLLATRSL